MKIVNETELMKNQKHAVLMAPDKQFEVLQTQQGNALFFSIGTDGIFYLTRETPEGSHGWSRIDLSSALSAQNNNAQITAKLFDVAQDLSGNATYIALAVTVNKVDLLYMVILSTDTINGWANADQDWANIAANGITWNLMDFDAGNDNKATLNIADINIFQGNKIEFLQADIIQGGSNTGDYVNRYYVDPYQNSGYYWNPTDLPAAMSAGNIHNEVGYLYAAEDAPGTYTLSGLKTLGTTNMELIFLPFYNAFDSDHPEDPSHITFQLPASTTAIAASQALGTGDASQYIPDDTDLFVAAGSSLYFVSHNVQTLGNVASGLIYTHDNLSGVQSLHVNNTASKTVIWGLNENGDVFYMSCAAGSEGNAAAWSVPAIIYSGVEEVATYIHNAQNSLVIFAETNGNFMMQLTQDAITSHWTYRDIHLPTADPMDMVENYTFTTHIQLTDDNNVPLLNQAVTITPNTACSLYINDSYHVLYANTPLSFTCDATGVITLVQAVDTLAGVCFTLADGDGTSVTVNPMANVLTYLNSLCRPNGAGPDLNVSVKDEMGNSTSLVDSSVSQCDKDQIAQYIANFMAMQSDVPADGSQQPDDEATYNPTGTPDKVYGVYIKEGKLVYYEGAAEARKVRALLHPNKTKHGLLGDVDADDSIEVLAGDGWRWLKSKVEDVVHWEIQKFGAINHFIFTIAEIEYHLVMRAIHDIANGIHFVLNKIKVAFEDLIKWLGSIFAWRDILTTHAVVKEYLLKYARYCVKGISDIKTQVDSITDTIESKISQITGLPNDSYSGSASSNTTDSGQSKPSSNWGNHHTKSNMVNSQCNHETDDPTSLLGDLISAAKKEEAILTNAAQQLEGVFSGIVGSSASAIMEQVLGVLANTVVGSAQNLLDALLIGAADVLTDIEDTLDAPIYIPVISPVYKMFAKADLSIMDFMCLMGAIPITVIYKIVNKGDAPFTSDDVNTFANAADFNAIAALCFVQSETAQESTKMIDIPTPPELTTNKMYDKLEFSGNILAAAGGYLVSIFATIRAVSDDYANNKWLATGAAISYLMYVGPDALGQVVVIQETDNEWYDIMNTAFAGYGVIKALVDLVMVLKKKPASATVIKAVGAPPPSGDDIPPVPNGNDDPPPNPDPAGPDPNAPQPGGAGDEEIEEDPLPAGPNIPADQGPTPSPKFNVPDSDAWDWLSPMLDFGLNAVWNVPVGFVFANSEKKVNDILGLVGNLLFNVSGMIAPVCSWGQGPIKWAAIGVADLCNFGYGAMSAATSLDNQPVDS